MRLRDEKNYARFLEGYDSTFAASLLAALAEIMVRLARKGQSPERTILAIVEMHAYHSN
jgi:fatty acid-binding protein DegV